MSTNPLSGASVNDLAKTLMQTYDTNSDGQLASDEFGTFLGKLLSGMQSTTAAAAGSFPITSVTNTMAFKLGAVSSGSVKFEGFNFDSTNNLRESAKYAFAAAAQKSGTMPTTKAEAESWFNTNIKSEMESLGHRINWVKGDKFQVTSPQGTFVVDFVRGADGSDPAIVWQPE